MSKVYKGYELLKAIADGEIKEGTKIEIKGRFSGDLIGSYFIYEEGAFSFPIYKPDNTEYFGEIKLHDIINWEFEPIEENETIDIDSIEELLKIEPYEADKTDITINRNKLNELVQAVKQLDKEVKELKSLNIEVSEKDINEAIKKARTQLKEKQDGRRY